MMEIINPEGNRPTPQELVSRAGEDNMSCPVDGCSGKIEARAPFWIEISPDGRPYLAAIGWFEDGQIECSHGGSAHISLELTKRLEPIFLEYCSAVETILGAEKAEDNMPKPEED